MLVTVRFLGALREQVGAPSVSLDLPDGAVYRDVLDAIAPSVSGRLSGWAWDSASASFSHRMLVSLNGAGSLRDEATVLSDGDEIVVVLPLGGG